MKLIPFSSQYLSLDEPLPFGVRDAHGRLFLAAGQKVPSAGRLDELKRLPLFADESEAADWNRRLAAAMDAALRQNSSLRWFSIIATISLFAHTTLLSRG